MPSFDDWRILMEVQHRIEEQISRHATALKQQVPTYLLMKSRTVVSFEGVKLKHFQNILTFCVSMNAASSTRSAFGDDHPTRPTEYYKISYVHSNFKKKWSECRSRKKNSNKVLITKIRGPQQELRRIGVLETTPEILLFLFLLKFYCENLLTEY